MNRANQKPATMIAGNIFIFRLIQMVTPLIDRNLHSDTMHCMSSACTSHVCTALLQTFEKTSSDLWLQNMDGKVCFSA